MLVASTNGRLYGWARGAAIATLGANVALWVGALVLTPPLVAPSEYFGAGAFWIMTVGSFTGFLCLLAVMLGMEYRVRSLGNGDPDRRAKLRRLALLLTPTLLHVFGLVGLVLYGFGRS